MELESHAERGPRHDGAAHTIIIIVVLDQFDGLRGVVDETDQSAIMWCLTSLFQSLVRGYEAPAVAPKNVKAYEFLMAGEIG